jgi:hypothetical protein
MTTPPPRPFRFWRWTLGCAFGAIALILVLLVVPPGEEKGTISNNGPNFEIKSLSITRGTKHVLFYPDRLHYWLREAYVVLRLGGKYRWRFIPTPQAGAIELETTDGGTAVLWVTCYSVNGWNPIAPLSLKDASGGILNLRPERYIWHPARRTLILCIPVPNHAASFVGSELLVETVDGRGTFQFK